MILKKKHVLLNKNNLSQEVDVLFPSMVKGKDAVFIVRKPTLLGKAALRFAHFFFT